MDQVITFGVRLCFEILKWVLTDDSFAAIAQTGRVDDALRGRLLRRIRLRRGKTDRLRA